MKKILSIVFLLSISFLSNGQTWVNNGIGWVWVTGASYADSAAVANALALKLSAGNNLSEITPATARANLGLVIGTNVLAPNGSAASLTSFPTLNQNTTGSAATLTTPRNINGVAFDGSANITLPASGTYQTCAAAATAATTGTMTTTMTSAAQTVFTITPTGTCTFNASGGTAGARMTFIITTSGTSSFTLTWSTNYKTTATLATGTSSGKVFCVSFICKDGTTWCETGRTTAM